MFTKATIFWWLLFIGDSIDPTVPGLFDNPGVINLIILVVMRYLFVITLSALMWSTATADYFSAFPLKPVRPSTSGLYSESPSMTMLYKIAPSDVQHSPDGEIDPVELKRFKGAAINAMFPINRMFVLEGELFEKSMASKRHQYDLESGKLALHFQFPEKIGGFRYGVSVASWANNADAIAKNTSVKFDDYRFSSILIHKPEDFQTDFTLNISRNIARQIDWNGFSTFGISRVTFSRITGFYEKGNCEYSFDVSKLEGTTSLVDQCGNILASEVYMPSEASLKNTIGFLPADDLEYEAKYWVIGSALRHRTGRWSNDLSYRWQQTNRGVIEDRVSEIGKESYTSSHLFDWKISYDLLGNIQLLGNFQYETHRLLTSQPLVYNAYTSSSFKKPGFFISFGLKVAM